MSHWSRNYSPRNTRLLRKLLKCGRIKVDADAGVILRRGGKPIAVKENHFGYQRFRVQIKRRGKWINAWFFVHKAVFLSTNPILKKHYEINHIDYDVRHNSIRNLEYIHRKHNRPRPEEAVEPAF